MSKSFLLTGHRGAAALEPENTLPSFYKAIECGATAVEFDVYPTRDGVAVVVHDEELSRLTGARALVTELTFSELSKLKVLGKARIPTLREVLAMAKGRLLVDIEIKKPGVEREVVEALRELEMVRDAIVTSFIPPVLSTVKELDPDIQVGVLLEEWDDEYLEIAKTLRARYVLPHFSVITPELIAKLRSSGMSVITWTVNDGELARRLIELGVEGVITDNPCAVKTAIGV